MMLRLLVRLQITADNLVVMRYFALLLLFSAVLCSCRFISSMTGEEVAARIGKAKLYKSEIERVIPKGVSKEDSLNFAGEYISSWAIKQLMFLKAEEELSREDKNVEQLLEHNAVGIFSFFCRRTKNNRVSAVLLSCPIQRCGKERNFGHKV